MRARCRIGVFGVAALVGLLAVGSAAAETASGGSTTHTVRVGDDTEAWYQTLPVSVCGLPIGCPPSVPLPGPTSAYPAGTLHIGVALDQETARSYLRPSLYSLPADAVLTGGTATLPLSTDPKAGNVNATKAAITACLVTAPVTDGVQGSLEDPPPVDCKVSSKVVMANSGGALTVNLAPFITAWRSGKPDYGFALLPVLGDITAAWQVALSGRSVAGAPHPSFSITYSEPIAGAVVPPTPPPVVSAPPVVQVAPPPVVPPAVTTTQAPVPAPVIATPQAAADVSSTGFKYSAVFLVPLVFLFGLLFLGRTFTRDATPLDITSGAAMRRH